MKSKTIWTLIGVIALIVIAYIIWKQYQKSNLVTTTNPNPSPNSKEIITGSNPNLNGCPKGSFVCSRDPYKCCKEVPDASRQGGGCGPKPTTECPKGFSWKCIEGSNTWTCFGDAGFDNARINMNSYNPNSYHGGGANGGANPAGLKV